MTDHEDLFQGERTTVVVSRKRYFNKNKRPTILKEIMKFICAFLNTAGNRHLILLQCKGIKKSKEIDDLKMTIENKIKDGLGPPVLIDYISIYCTHGRNLHKVIVQVKPSVHFVTFKYNIYFPAESQIYFEFNSINRIELLVIWKHYSNHELRLLLKKIRKRRRHQIFSKRYF